MKRKTMYAVFAGLEKVSDRGLCKVLWWGLRKLGVDEWVICLVKAMYNNSLSSVQVNGCYSEPFKWMVSVHQGLVPSRSLVAYNGTLSRAFRVSCPS